MPVITVTLGQGQVSTQKKEEFIEAVTKTAVEITKLPERTFTILIHELESANIGVGGKCLTQIQSDRK